MCPNFVGKKFYCLWARTSAEKALRPYGWVDAKRTLDAYFRLIDNGYSLKRIVEKTYTSQTESVECDISLKQLVEVANSED